MTSFLYSMAHILHRLMGPVAHFLDAVVDGVARFFDALVNGVAAVLDGILGVMAGLLEIFFQALFGGQADAQGQQEAGAEGFFH